MRLRVVLLLAALAACDRAEDDPKPFSVGGKQSSGPLELRPEGAPGPGGKQPAQQPAQQPTAQAQLPPVPNDPLNTGDVTFLRARAQAVLQKLVAALEPKPRGLVQGAPLAYDPKPGEVNAFAGCSKAKRPIMVITDDLMRIQAGVARAEAHDQVFGTKKRAAYLELVAKGRRTGQAVPALPAGFYAAAQDADGRKVARQHQLFDEELAFVLGHELAHHYLAHTGCTGSDASELTPADLARTLAQALPAFNQPSELAADLYGTYDALGAGYTEQGGLLTLEFFLALRGASGGSIRFSFEDTHPDPNVRIPVVKEAAAAWRAGGGKPLPVWTLPTLR